MNGGESNLDWLDETAPALSTLTDEEIESALSALDTNVL